MARLTGEDPTSLELTLDENDIQASYALKRANDDKGERLKALQNASLAVDTVVE